jgi:hypothetical protein
MAERTQVRDHTLAPTGAQLHAAPVGTIWGKIGQGIVHTFFWAYERGTWQYDLMVIAIVAFIFLTPRSWFDDRPTLQMTDLRNIQGIVEVSQSKEGRTYLVDARLVESMSPVKPEEAIREILRARVQRPFAVKSVDLVRDRNNVVLGYTVAIVFQ